MKKVFFAQKCIDPRLDCSLYPIPGYGEGVGLGRLRHVDWNRLQPTFSLSKSPTATFAMFNPLPVGAKHGKRCIRSFTCPVHVCSFHDPLTILSRSDDAAWKPLGDVYRIFF